MSRKAIRTLEAKIAKKQDGLLACYEIIAEQQPKLERMKAELQALRTATPQASPAQIGDE